MTPTFPWLTTLCWPSWCGMLVPQYPSLRSPCSRCWDRHYYITPSCNYLNRIIGMSCRRYFFSVPRTARRWRYGSPKSWHFWDSHIYSYFQPQPYLHPYCWWQPSSYPRWWPWHSRWRRIVRIWGSTINMMKILMMTLRKMDWGTMWILVGLMRMKMLPEVWWGLYGCIEQYHRQLDSVQLLMGGYWYQYLDKYYEEYTIPLMGLIRSSSWATRLVLHFRGSIRCTIRYRLRYPLSQWT